MKKKPIYLYVLLAMSSLLTLWGALGQFTTTPDSVIGVIKESYQKQNIPETQVEEFLKLFRKTTEFDLNTAHKVFVVVSLLLLFVALFLLIKKRLLQANLTYLGYLLLKILFMIYNFVGKNALIRSVQTSNSALIEGTIQLNRMSSIIGIVFVFIPISLVLYKLWRQQKAVEE
ncbi:ABC transporter permease [Streptococcus himalayensis]|uniref:Uncharacterized protein n=1 Tax=Streptococcus himalayensis TaxID=1888195 RepID=A0A917A3K1_9STRE|nr:hypothetical protein [Streptococcus himalayensis]GGE23312.1 hypothetical protein GCM10011510_00450 [Streptococcus himalayensis]